MQKLHESGALIGAQSHKDKHLRYFPRELVNYWPSSSDLYHCYRIGLRGNFKHDVAFTDIILAVQCVLEYDSTDMNFELECYGGTVTVSMVYVGVVDLTHEQVLMARRFQITILRILIEQNLDYLIHAIDGIQQNDPLPRVNYLLLPSVDCTQSSSLIDWDCIKSSVFPQPGELNCKHHYHSCSTTNYAGYMWTKDGAVCRCVLVNSIIFTSHNGVIYFINDILDELDGNSFMKGGQSHITYKEYFQSQHGIKLQKGESLLGGRRIFKVHNSLQKHKYYNEKEWSNACVELPPELCSIILTPISISTLYSFSLVPSIMYQVESMLLALNLKKVLALNYNIPTVKILEAITTKQCQEKFSLESLETLGDSFLKYAASQQLFREKECYNEGLLTAEKERMVSNSALCKLGCDRKLQGFIRQERYDPKKWVIPGDSSIGCSGLGEISLSTSGKIHVMGERHMKGEVIADVVEALIGAYLITAGELAALTLMDWLGMKVNFVNEVPNGGVILLQPEKHVNVRHLESLLNYKFHDPSLLVEALTHGSCLPKISRSYQRLEFLGDSVLDYLITIYMYNKYPGVSPGQLTNLRSSSVNNDCYALATVKAGLHKHILHASSELQREIDLFIDNSEQFSSGSTFGWESKIAVPKVLADVIESLAGAILVDSGYNRNTVWECIRPILEPLVTLDTLKLEPVKELDDLCKCRLYEKRILESFKDGEACISVEVEANGTSYVHTCSARNKKTALKLASKVVLDSLKERDAADVNN